MSANALYFIIIIACFIYCYKEVENRLKQEQEELKRKYEIQENNYNYVKAENTRLYRLLERIEQDGFRCELCGSDENVLCYDFMCSNDENFSSLDTRHPYSLVSVFICQECVNKMETKQKAKIMSKELINKIGNYKTIVGTYKYGDFNSFEEYNKNKR